MYKSQSKDAKLKVAVLCGGPSSEHEVSLASGRNVYEALNRDRFTPELLVWERDCPSPEKTVDFGSFDVVFLALHGSYGEDGRIQAVLDLNTVPYTGSGVAASSLGMDKPLSKLAFQAAGIPTPEFAVIKDEAAGEEAIKRFGFPCVIKPSSQGSSAGVAIIRDLEQTPLALGAALSFDGRAVIECYIGGREFSCGILGNEDPSALPLVEIIPRGEFFDYKAKYTPGAAKEIVPARLNSKKSREMQNLALAVYKLLGCRGFGRVDILLSSEEEPYVLEINTIPGMTENSLLPKEAAAAGIAFPELLEMIVNFALEK